MSLFGVILVCIFPNLDWIRKDTKYLSVFSPIAGKYGPENSNYGHCFHAVIHSLMIPLNENIFTCKLGDPVLKSADINLFLMGFSFVSLKCTPLK